MCVSHNQIDVQPRASFLFAVDISQLGADVQEHIHDEPLEHTKRPSQQQQQQVPELKHEPIGQQEITKGTKSKAEGKAPDGRATEAPAGEDVQQVGQ